jgi:hypothetical protein
MTKRAYRVLLLSLAVPAGLFAQGVQATLNGRVTDSSGAVIPNVRVEVKNSQTNQVTPVVTDAVGVYTAPFLPPGTYTISADAAGFKTFTREGLVLNVSQTVTVDLVLEVGSQAERVTITAETPLLETSKADRGSVIDSQRVRELPLNGRNPFMLSKLVAGVNFNGQALWERPFDNGAISYWSINGGLQQNNEFLLDGAPNNSQAGTNNIAYVPPVDSVQEFKIQTNSYDAQYGKTSGGIINVSLKSGTNALHGTVYEFARRKGWDANSFQNNAQGLAKDEHYLDQFGWQVDGPIYIPKLYNGRNKSFFLFNYEGYREGTPRPQLLSTPAPEFLQGDFSKLLNGQGRQIVIYDPTTGRDVNGAWVRNPFPGNVIPSGRISPIAQKIVQFFPKPNTTTPGSDYSQQNYFFSGDPAVDKDRFYNVVVKLDHQFGDKHHLFFRAGSNDRTEMGYDGGNGILGPGQYGSLPEKRINDAYVLDWVGVLTPRTVVNARVSFARYLAEDRGDLNKGFDLTTLGFPASMVGQLNGGAYFGRYDFSNYQNMGEYPNGNITNTWAFAPSVNRNARGHSLKAGMDLRWIQYVSYNYGYPFYLSADAGWTQKDYNRSDALSGNSIASFLLGTPSGGYSDFNAIPTYMYKYAAPWFQDDWRVNRRLTLNVGLRWDFNIPPNERYNRMNRGFDPNVVNPVDKLIDRTKFPDLPTLKGSLLFAGVNGQSRTAANTYKRALQPRIGAAWQASEKLVIRGGWGRYYLNPTNSYLQSLGFSYSTPMVNSLDGGRTPISNLIANPFPNGLQKPPGASLGALSYVGQGFSYVNSDFRLPHINQFSLGFQWELPGRSKVEVSYVGSRGADEQTSASLNFYPLANRKQCNLMEGGNPLWCDQRIANPYYQLAPFAGTSWYSSPTLGRTTFWTPYPEFGGLTTQMRNDGKSWYNSLQVVYETRWKSGWNLMANYTLSKMTYRNGFNDIQNGVLQQGVYQWDRPHSINIASIYALPIGRGKRFLNTSHRVWSRLLSGWENTVMLRYQSGLPWSMPGAIYVKEAKIPNIDWSAARVQGVQPCVAKWNDDNTITMQPFSVAAGCTSYNFLIPPRYTPSRFTPNYDTRLRLHSLPLADVSLNKTTRITEKTTLQFRAEAFNVTNTFWMGQQQFNNNTNSSNFGSITKAGITYSNGNQPRFIQLGVKFLW